MRRASLALFTVVLLALALAAASTGHAAAPYTYVALGDSFSSGEGISPYLRDPADPTSQCDRSSRAYATWVQPPGFSAPVYALASGGGSPGAARLYGSSGNVRAAGGTRWALWACSGAETGDVLPRSLGGAGQGQASAQLDSASLQKADLVTLTIGGNDAGYVELLVNCGLFRCNTPAFRNERTARIAALKPRLERVYRAVAARAPSARILVLGYANPFPATPAEQSCAALRPFAGEQDMIRALGARLNATIAAAVVNVARSGAKIRFVPVAARFAGHEVCGRKGAWMNGIVQSRLGFGIDPGSFHPNLLGQRDGYGAAVNAALR
jgi:lysophospholipase L1-like esterase